MKPQILIASAGVIACLAGCATSPIIDMSGANYVGTGHAAVDIALGDASASFGAAARADSIRVNELGRSGKWTLDFNDIPITTGAAAGSTAYVTIELPSKPTAGTMRAKVTTEIFKPDRYTGNRVRDESKRADVVFVKADLVKDGTVSGKIALASGGMVVDGEFDLRLTDAPPLFSGPH